MLPSDFTYALLLDMDERADNWKLDSGELFGEPCKVAQRNKYGTPEILIAYDYVASESASKLTLLLDNMSVPTDEADAATITTRVRKLAEQQKREHKLQQERKIDAAMKKFVTAVKGAA
jgi:hypothetical protein